jgi:Na+/melibiose symporter-like transporter
VSGATQKERTGIESVRAITNLVAVLAGIIAVAVLTVVAVELLNGDEKSESAVAITTAAFGIISTVITAYLGIKATANAAGKSEEASHEAAVARYEEGVKEKKVDRFNEEIDKLVEESKLTQDSAEKLRGASVDAEKRARRTDP